MSPIFAVPSSTPEFLTEVLETGGVLWCFSRQEALQNCSIHPKIDLTKLKKKTSKLLSNTQEYKIKKIGHCAQKTIGNERKFSLLA